jgi:hypothetical protein
MIVATPLGGTLSSATINAGTKNHHSLSSRQCLQAIFVMQSGQDRVSDHAVTGGDPMSVWLREPLGRHVGNTRA